LKKLAVARLGRSVGLRGEMKLHDLSDFPQQFVEGAIFQSDRGELEIERYNPRRGTIKFKGVDTPEDAKRLTNAYLYSTQEQTKEQIELGEGEYFWFDILGSDVYESGELLGKVEDIQRFPAADYLLIKTDKRLTDRGMPKSFMIPFLDRFIQEVDTERKRIDVVGGKEILEAS